MNNEEIGQYVFPAHSALYHCIKGLIFTRKDFAHKTIKLIPDENNRNFDIKNKKRLKNTIFKSIMHNYNQRLDKYALSYPKFSHDRNEDLEINKYKLISGGDEEEYSGIYSVFPKTFVCKRCGDFRNIRKKEIEHFDPRNCKISSCNGEYEQVSILMFCEDCGKIVPLYYSCKKHGSKNIRLSWKEKDSLLTWKVVCWDCYVEGSKEPVDIFRFTCNHRDNNEKICDAESKKFKPLTIKEGGIFTPVVITTIDIPSADSIRLEDLEYILLGLYLNKFDKISKDGSETNLEQIDSYYQGYNNPNLRPYLSSEVKNFIENVKKTIEQLKSKYKNVNLQNFNDYFAIIGKFSGENTNVKIYDEYINEITDPTRKEMLKRNYNSLKQRYGIDRIRYISNINLISSCIGIINGINKFYEPGFVPHFDPLWKNAKKKDKFMAYSYPFETEGILIDLDKVKLCKWLVKNGILEKKEINKIGKAKEILSKIQKGTESYEALKTLLHTFAHTLIRRSSLYTGLDSDSCGELIFVNTGAVLIYSTSNINIGGFQYVFEHSLNKWFKEVELEIRDCTLDPTCIFENGACFSCLYLPEFVCTSFNQSLDRDVFIGGTNRYEVGYW